MVNEIAVQFRCHDDELIGICHPGSNDKGILIVTGGPQYRIGSHRQFLLLARGFSSASYPVFRFDYRGMGDSSEHTHVSDFEDTAPDIISAIQEFKRLQPHIKEFYLLGLCDGASAILIAIPEIKEHVAGIILINPWVYQDSTLAKAYLKFYYIRRLRQKEFWGKLLKFKINFRHSFRSIKRKYSSAFTSNRGAKVKKPGFIDRMFLGLLHFQGNILTLLSDDDLTAKEFQLFVKDNKTWDDKLSQTRHKSVILSGADHTFSNQRSRQQVLDHILTWLAIN